MDGLPPYAAMMQPRVQRTLASAIGCVGVGLHSGARIKLDLLPAPVGTGIVFRRTDLAAKNSPENSPKNSPEIVARYDTVSDTRLCTVISAGDARVGTVEHLLAALAACEVDNAVVALDGPEVPVLDGSAAHFAFLIGCAGVTGQGVPTRQIEVLKRVRVEAGPAFAELRPRVGSGLDLSVSIDFPAAAIGRQALSIQLTQAAFHRELADARTFTMAEDIAGLRSAGLARGGSLDNAVVVDGGRILNPGGLRRADEFVRHKMLDAVGDLALAGARLNARFVAHRPGHALNNRLLHALFADRTAWTWREAPVHAGWGGVPLAAAAAPM